MTGSEKKVNIIGGESDEADNALDAPERERQQRVEALHTLLGENAQPSATARVDGGTNVVASDQRRTNWRRASLIGLVALVIVGSVTGYLLVQRSRSQVITQKPAAVQAINLRANNLYCPQTPVWTPDGRQIAIIASDVRCIEPNNTATPDQYIGIFDVTTGKPQRIVDVKNVLAHYQLSGSVSAISWSTDGKTLAIFGPVLATSTIGVNRSALVLYPTTNQQATARVIIAPPQPDPYRLQVWNLHTLSAGPAIDSSLASALTYRWTADGHIVPDRPFPADASGATDRTTSTGDFTFWQAGYLAAWSIIDGHYTNIHTTPNGVVKPTGVFFSALPVLWSPDGQYVVSGISISGPVAFSTPPASTLTCPSPRQDIPCPSQSLPQPDPAFAAVVKATLNGEQFTFTTQSGNQATGSNWPQVSVAWSPNGKYLLTILPGNEERDGAKKMTATVFDTTTGDPIKQFQQDIPPGKAACYGGAPVWSPDGARIVIFQCSSDSIVLWDAHSLSA